MNIYPYKTLVENGRVTHVVVPVRDFDKYMLPRRDERVRIPASVAYKIADGESEFRAWREHAGLTQEEVATRMDKSRPAYAQNEKKGRKPHRETIEAFARAIGVDARHIIGSFDDEPLSDDGFVMPSEDELD